MRSSYRRATLDGQPLHPDTQMVSFGYDPALSEGAVKPPVFLTSTFAFRSAEEGAEFFDVVAGRKPAPEGMGAGWRSAFGFQLDPHSCWMLTRSMETLSLRMERAAESGRKVAGWLAENGILPCAVLHPEFGEDRRFAGIYARQCTGPGSTFAFVVENDRALAFRILNALELFKLAVSLGGTESLVCHPASTTHSGVPQAVRDGAGVTEGLIRLSVGMEHPDDLVRDLGQAFRRAASRAE